MNCQLLKTTEFKITQKAVEESATNIIPAGEVVISTHVGLGKVCVLAQDTAINQDLKAVIPTSDLSRPYLYHWFVSKAKVLISNGTGATVKGVTVEFVKQLEIPLPPLPTQRVIAEELDRICELKRTAEKLGEKYRLLIKAKFSEMFGDVGCRKFASVKLKEVMQIKHGYAFEGDGISDVDNGIVIVTPGNFKIGGGFKSDKNRFYSKYYPIEYVLSSGSLVVTMTDLSKRSDTLGCAAIVPNDEKTYLHNQRIGLAHSFRSDVHVVYLEYAMRTQEYRESVLATQVGSTVHHTSPTKILESPIPLPPLPLQQQFAAFVEKVEKLEQAAKATVEKYDLLYRSKLQEYFG